LSSSATARLRAAWLSDRNYSPVISASAAVACIKDFLDNCRNLLSSPTVVQALSQCGTVMRFGEFLQKIGSKGVWSPTSQVQHEVIDKLGTIIEGQINRKVSSEQIFGKSDLFEFLEQVETPVPQWADLVPRF